MLRSILNQLGSMAIALIIALIVWSIATNEQFPSREGDYPADLPIQVVNTPAGLVVFNPSATAVKLRISAPQASWDQLSPNSFRVVADLKGLGEGTHQVPLRVDRTDSRVIVIAFEPSSINVQLEPLKSRVFDVHADIPDSAPPGFTAKPAVVSPSQVTVSGPRVLVDQVSEVVATLFLRGAKAPVERQSTIVAKDVQGNPVQGVSIAPATVTVGVQVEQQVGYKDVSIKTVLKGTPASGYWISNMTVNPSTATIVGSADALAKLQGYVETVPIDITGATLDVSRSTNLNLPDGVSVLNNTGFSVQVSISPILGGQTFPRKVTVQGARRGLSVTVSPASVDVILSGPIPSLNSLQSTDVQVSVDVSDKGPGTYQIKARILALPDALKVQSILPDTVQVTIVEVPSTATPSGPITGTVPITTTIGTVTPPPK